MKTVSEVFQGALTLFTKKEFPEPKREAEWLIADAFGWTKLQLYMHWEHLLDEEELAVCRERIKRRLKKEPWQYIKGEIEFFGVRIKTSEKALIPRQETEILASLIAERLKKKGSLEGKVLVDLCTGSGCIGISLKKKFSDLKVILSDICEDALSLARENSKKNEVDVSIYQGDFLHPLKKEKIDFLVCNPPYISEEEYFSLENEVKDFEPKKALVSGQTGLEFYKTLSEEVFPLLNPQANLFFEIGATQGEEVLNLFSTPFWEQKKGKKEIIKDYSGKDRFFFLECE